ncbi:MAG: AMP-binding protein [Alphaproteobacteria bacterium]|nr:AMP-binding protein [Alphaproteobacteria bacterium]
MNEPRHGQADTFPKLLIENARTRGSRPAYRQKYLGIWQTHTWQQAADIARETGLGLASLGMKRGDKVALIGQNTTLMYISFDAIQSVGGIPVPLYADSVAEEMTYVLDHAGVRFAMCQDQEQIDKIETMRDRVPEIEHLIYEEHKGMRRYEQPDIHSIDALREAGREFDRANPGFFDEQVALGTGSDLAIIVYTSGTTGNPKGVMLSYDALCRSARLARDLEGLGEDEEVLAYLPLAWVGDHFISHAQHHVTGFTVNCPESPDTLVADLRDIGPTLFIAPPAIFENFLTQIGIRIADAARIKQALYKQAIALAHRVGEPILNGEAVGPLDRLMYRFYEFCIYGPLKNMLGFSRTSIAYTGGAPLGEEVFSFYRSIGVNLKQLYGQTESCAYVCLQRNGDARLDTVGPPAPEVEVRFTDAGELLYRSPGNFLGYYRNNEATSETLDADGWVHTGDAGILTDSGHIKIIDRARDVGTMTDGTVFAPQYIENKLKFYPFIREAVAHGTGRDYATAFINIDLEAVGNFAEREGLGYSGYMDLSQQDQVYDLIQRNIEEVNRDLARDSTLASSQIRRFLILHKELDADDGELTRTRKLRRRIIGDRYNDLIEALYSDRDHIQVSSRVTFEDGRVGEFNADVKIRNVTNMSAGSS